MMKLELDAVSKHYESTYAVDEVSLVVDSATQVLVLIGPSGGGKSTLLRMIGGLEVPTKGRVLHAGEPLSSEEDQLRRFRQKNGFLFQTFNLFPHLSALDNIALPLEKVHGMATTEAAERAKETLDRFGLGQHGQKT
ncbi:MAG: ATP-binding cassette domain-containing protein, partial [Verrucomicrobiota bacterium]